MKEALLVAQERICLPACSGMLQIFSPLLCQFSLRQYYPPLHPPAAGAGIRMSCLVSRLPSKPPQWVKEDRKEETLSLLKAGNGYNHTSPNCQSQQDSAKGRHVLCRVWQCLRQPLHPLSFHHSLPGYIPVPGFSPCQHTQGFVLLWGGHELQGQL